MKVIYEDNHIIIVNKQAGEIVQGDKTGDRTLADDVKAYIKEKYAKPGDVFLGVVHRLDRPVSGVVVFARTSKALSRLNDMFRTGKIQKTYQAIVPATEKSAATPDGEWVTVDTWLTQSRHTGRLSVVDTCGNIHRITFLHRNISGTTAIRAFVFDDLTGSSTVRLRVISWNRAVLIFRVTVYPLKSATRSRQPTC